jgi:hypothetical protein
VQIDGVFNLDDANVVFVRRVAHPFSLASAFCCAPSLGAGSEAPSPNVEVNNLSFYDLGMKPCRDRMIRLAWAATCVIAVTSQGCGPAAPARDVEQPVVGDAPAPSANPFAVTGALQREPLPDSAPAYPLVRSELPPAPPGLTAVTATCRAFGARKPGSKASCIDPSSAHGSLDAALALSDPSARDEALLALESCGHLPLGMARALRAELAPPACGDVIVGSLVREPPPGMPGVIYDALAGLALSGRLSRAAVSPPKLAPPYTKESVTQYIDSAMGAWVKEQATAIQALAVTGAKLRHYGKAVVAVEAGLAEMRFIDAVRKVPVPEEIAKFDEAKEKYYQRLESQLEARKRRGRDAALVGLGQLAQIGVIRGLRVDRARTILSRMYGGSPINALDGLQLPPLKPLGATNAEQRLAARLPTFYAGLVLGTDGVNDPIMLRMLIEKGMPIAHRIALSKTELSPPLRCLYARARFELAQNYWRSVDIDEAIGLLAQWPADSQRPEGASLLLALGIALRGGPANAAEMMVRAPLADLRIGNVVALDALADGGGKMATMAAFDAALIKQLSAPATATAAYWRDVAARFRKAAALMDDLHDRADAEQRASEAEQTAAAIEQGAAAAEPLPTP